MWYSLALLKGYKKVEEPALDLVSKQGRAVFLKMIYEALVESGRKNLAKEWFDKNKDFYHPLAREELAKAIGI